MPKIKSYTPAWLSKPAPGHDLFTSSREDQKNALFYANSGIKPRSQRTIAQSGSQVFVAVGREVRWADLIQLKEQWQAKAAQDRRGSRIKREDSFGADDDDNILRASAEDGYAGFRTLKVSVGADIQELVISPYGDYLAVLTSHTVRICAVPDLSLLSIRSNEVIKPKTWTLGPTTHVMDRSSIASAIWHPLGVNGSTLVTVTTDAVVRVWELSATDRWSFDTPTLNIDLRKLADGTYLDENFSVRPEATNKGFSADSFEMDVAASCFGRRGSGGWSPMTLWIAMREGDLYALCPLLPTRWCPPPTLIPSLSVSIVGNLAAIEDDPIVSSQAKLLAQQQLDWMSELDNQEPLQVKGPPEEPVFEVYARPSKPGVVPRLQGPFEFELGVDTEADMDLELSDIFVIGQKLDTDELMMGEDEELDVDDIDQDGLSLNVICLLSSSGQLRICLDLVGVQAQWLPPRSRTMKGFRRQMEDITPPTLLTFETLDTLSSLEMTEDGWPMFSPDVTSRYSFYVTHPAGITHVSLSPWVFRLETELQGESQAGSDFRVDLLTKTNSTRERLYTNPVKGDAQVPLAAAVAIRDPDLGYFLLSATPFEPVALIFDAPESELEPIRPISPVFDRNDDMPPLTMYEPRPTFQPSHAFNENSALPHLLERLRTSRHKGIVSQEVRLSPVTLQVFTDAHKILSEETYRLGIAASELFRRLETLQSELKQQITKANEVKARVEAITGEDQEGSEPESSNDAIERRLEAAQTRGEAISQRLERMRKKLSRATSRELSENELAWIKEVNAVNTSISGSSAVTTDGGASRLRQLGRRYNEAKALKEDLVAQAEKLIRPTSADGDEVSVAPTELRIPQELRRAKINDVRRLLERETALVDAVKSRLEKLEVDI